MPATARRIRVRHAPVYVIPGSHPGLIVPGNLDLTRRPVVRNPNGSISTVRSVSWNLPVKVHGHVRNLEVLMPEVIGNRVVSDRVALAWFQETGQHLGMFDTVPHANAYALALHRWQADFYRRFLKKRR